MTSVDLPLYVVAIRNQWVTDTGTPDHAIPAFGTPEDARAYVRGICEQRAEPMSLFRIVEFRHTGNVMEA